MSIGKTGGLNNFQRVIDQQNLAKTRTVTAEQGRTAAQNSGVVSDKVKDSELNPGGEKLVLSDKSQAHLAQEQQMLKDDLDQARAGLADKANQSHGDKKAKEKEHKIGERRVEQKAERRVFPLDDDSEGTYEVPEADGKRLDALDRKTPEQILQGMPEHARAAATATLNSQMETKGVKKIANLKDDPKVSDQVENMELNLADSSWRDNTLAPIRTPKNEPPLQMDDPHAEATAKEAAIRQMQSGGEQMIA